MAKCHDPRAGQTYNGTSQDGGALMPVNTTPLGKWLPSRTRHASTTTIVLHATDGKSAGSSISWLRQIGLSYHYIIERDGEIFKCVPISRVAFHAGRSVGPEGPNVNGYSIGIAFANYESGQEKITAEQIVACAELVQDLSAGSWVSFLTTHYWVSPGRKTDPSMLPKADIFRMAKAAGIRVWESK
jgi:N-acetylmuramoyl-L-alanine amidase